MTEDDIEKLKAKKICDLCIEEDYLASEVSKSGTKRKCTYCGKSRQTIRLGDLAERVDAAFQQHYGRTSDQPTDFQYSMLSDRESQYDWERDGEPVVYAIMNAAIIPEKAAHDIQLILSDEYSDFDSAKMGEETEYSADSHYEEKGADDRAWQEEWSSFENTLKTEARFFSRSASEHLSSVFDGIETMKAYDGSQIIETAGPNEAFNSLFRARVFQSQDKLEAALARPDVHLGSPPALLAAAGRMNARGISVFYGARELSTAIAEVRPPVGAYVATATYKFIRQVRLLNLPALNALASGGSVFDTETVDRMERATFLKSLAHRMTRAVMPDDESLEYLPTQAVADFLANGMTVPIDGIIFKSVQAEGSALNVVLFHRAAKIKEIVLPDGAEIRTRSGFHDGEGWEFDFSVIVETPAEADQSKKETADRSADPFVVLDEIAYDGDPREPTLQIDLETLQVHVVNHVEFKYATHLVTRYEWKKSEPAF